MGWLSWLFPKKNRLHIIGPVITTPRSYVKDVKVLDDNYVEATILDRDGEEWHVRVRRRPTFPPA
jgi:hypothetical protein